VQVTEVHFTHAQAADHMARCGIIHGDIKEDNVLVGFDGRCVVADFGLSMEAPSAASTAPTERERAAAMQHSGIPRATASAGGPSLIPAFSTPPSPWRQLLAAVRKSLRQRGSAPDDTARSGTAPTRPPPALGGSSKPLSPKSRRAVQVCAHPLPLPNPLQASYLDTYSMSLHRAVLPPEVLNAFDFAEGLYVVHREGPPDDETVFWGAGCNGATGTHGDVVIDFSRQAPWSIGLMLYELAAGHGALPAYPKASCIVRPHTQVSIPQAGTEEAAYDVPGISYRWDQIPLLAAGTYPDEFRSIVRWLLHPDPRQRMCPQEALVRLLDNSALHPQLSHFRLGFHASAHSVATLVPYFEAKRKSSMAPDSTADAALSFDGLLCPSLLAPPRFVVVRFTNWLGQVQCITAVLSSSLGSMLCCLHKDFVLPTEGEQSQPGCVLLGGQQLESVAVPFEKGAREFGREEAGAHTAVAGVTATADGDPCVSGAAPAGDNIVDGFSWDPASWVSCRDVWLVAAADSVPKVATAPTHGPKGRSSLQLDFSAVPEMTYMRIPGVSTAVPVVDITVCLDASDIVDSSLSSLLQRLQSIGTVLDEGGGSGRNLRRALGGDPYDEGVVAMLTPLRLPNCDELNLGGGLHTAQDDEAVEGGVSGSNIEPVRGVHPVQCAYLLERLQWVAAQAIRSSVADFPFLTVAGVATTIAHTFSHHADVLTATMGVLRCVSCTRELQVASDLVSAYSAVEWAMHGLREEALHFRPSAIEDALMAIANLLRFPELQSGIAEVPIPVADIAEVAVYALYSLDADNSEHFDAFVAACSAFKYLSQCIFDEETASAVASHGLVQVIVSTLHPMRRQREEVEELMTALSNLLVFESVRDAHTDYKAAAEGVLNIMHRPQYAQAAALQTLAINCIRNLACVCSGEGTSSLLDDYGMVQSPAYYITQLGAAVAVEETMERMPEERNVQENGRCCLYNLLLISTNDMALMRQQAKAFLQRAQEAEAKTAALQKKLTAAAASATSHGNKHMAHTAGSNGVPPGQSRQRAHRSSAASALKGGGTGVSLGGGSKTSRSHKGGGARRMSGSNVRSSLLAVSTEHLPAGMSHSDLLQSEGSHGKLSTVSQRIAAWQAKSQEALTTASERSGSASLEDGSERVGGGRSVAAGGVESLPPPMTHSVSEGQEGGGFTPSPTHGVPAGHRQRSGSESVGSVVHADEETIPVEGGSISRSGPMGGSASGSREWLANTGVRFPPPSGGGTVQGTPPQASEPVPRGGRVRLAGAS